VHSILNYCLVSISVVEHCSSAQELLHQSQPMNLVNRQMVVKTCTHAAICVTTMLIERSPIETCELTRVTSHSCVNWLAFKS